MAERDPLEDLRRIVFLLDRAMEPEYRAKAFLGAARLVAELGPEEIRQRAEAGTLQELSGIGKSTATAITESVRGEVPAYLAALEPGRGRPDRRPAARRCARR